MITATPVSRQANIVDDTHNAECFADFGLGGVYRDGGGGGAAFLRRFDFGMRPAQ